MPTGLQKLGAKLLLAAEAIVEILWDAFWRGLKKVEDGLVEIIVFLIKNVWPLVSDVFEEIWQAFWRGIDMVDGPIESFAKRMGRLFNKNISGGKNTVFDAFTNYITQGAYDPEIKDAIRKFFFQSNDIAQLFAFMGIPSAVLSLIFTAETSTYVLRKQQDDMEREQLGLIDAGFMANVWNVAGGLKGVFADHLARQGLPASMLDAIAEASKQWLALPQLALAAQRGVATQAAMQEQARNLGISQVNIEAAFALAKQFSPLAQIATAALHGDISDTEIDRQARLQGFSNADVEIAKSVAKVFLSPQAYAVAAQRQDISGQEALQKILKQGYDQTDVDTAKSLARTLLTPITLVNALWRGFIQPSAFERMMGEAGYSPEDAKVFLDTAYFLPTPSDLISWVSKEVFEGNSITKYGLDDEFGNLDLALFAKIGISPEQVRNYWIAHWQHPSFTQIGEMYIRDVLVNPEDRNTQIPGSPDWKATRARAAEEVDNWFKLVEVPPFWRQRMVAIINQPYTRVDIRRMWDLDVVTDDEVVRAYLDQGYDLEHAQNLLAFTKVERGYPDLVARYKNGWIDQAEVLETLMSYGVKPDAATRLYQRKFANLEKPTRIATERDLTKTEIIAGVKKELLDVEEAIGLLMGLGYDKEEAELIVLINVDFTGSPESPLEFRRGVETYRKALGKSYVEIPQSIIDTEKQLLAARSAAKDANIDGKSDEKSVALRTALARLEAQYSIDKKLLGL